MKFARSAVLSALFLSLACDPDPVVPPPTDAGVPVDAPPPEPTLEVDRYCPGMAGCTSGDDTGLRAGAALRDISPDMTTAETLTTDLNGNGEFDEAMGDTFDDVDGDGLFEGEWIAGFGTGRAASAINEENRPWVRTLVLANDDVTVAFVSVDAVGIFIDEMDLIRDAVDAAMPGAVDYVFVSATHCHETRDTIGIWGASISDSGYNADYMALVRDAAVETVVESLGALEPANIEIASFFLRDVDTSSEPGVQTDVLRYVGDNRDPFIFDDQVRVMRLVAEDGTGGTAGTTDTIATFLNYAAHPEYQGSSNTVISADFVGWMRNGIEEGAIGPDGETLPGVGGVTVFVNGAVGVQIGPNYIHPAEWDGTEVGDEGDEAAQTVGEQLAWHVLDHMDEPSEMHDSFPLGFRRARFPILVQNTNYHIAFSQNLFGPRDLFDYDPTMSIRRDRNLPSIRTEVAVFDMGPIQMLTMPGELDPLLFVGIHGDRAFTPAGRPVVDPAQVNPADLSTFPEDGYLIDHMRADARTSDNVWLLGLTNDFTGYYVAPWDYELASTPYLVEAPGDHYEETNSVGPLAWPRIERLTRALLAWTAP